MNIENLSILDQLRYEYNSDELNVKFQSFMKEDKRKTVNNLNNNKLQFPTLYLLIPSIKELDLYSKLSWRNKLAIKVCRIIQNEKKTEQIDRLASGNKVYQVLQWMFETGYIEDGLNDDYDEILDGIVALLIMKYGDHDILPTVVEMLFERNRKGMLIHDLAWSFFHSNNIITLKLISKYLQSKDKKDIQLANKLLHIGPAKLNVQDNSHGDSYEIYRNWLDKNEAYLYFTNESFQLTSDPTPCKINVEAKYLNNKVSPEDGKFRKPLSQKEKKYLQQFDQVADLEKEKLANYSNQIHQLGTDLWKKWIENDIELQILNVKNNMEGER